MFCYWELLNFHRLILQHAGIFAGSCLLAFAAMSTIKTGGGLALRFGRAVSSGPLLWGLLALAFAACLAVALYILQDFSNSADEYSCLFLAKCFLSHKLYATTDALKDFFTFTHIGEKDGKWFSLYPPGWPLLLALGLAVKTPWAINPMLATATLLLLYRIGKKVGDGRSALLACLWVGCSSFFLLYAGSYYSHVTCLFVLTAFTGCFMEGMDEGGHAGWLFASGLFLGYAMMTRYLTAIAYGAPFGLYLLYRGCVRRDLKFAHLAAFALGLAVFNLAQLWFQYRVTGSAFLTPIHYYRQHERLGFSHDFLPAEGIGQTLFRMVFYAQWVVPVFWLFIAGAFFLPKKGLWDKIFLWAGLLSGAAYTLYFSFGGGGYGPRYFFESVGVFGIMGAKAFFALWDRLKGSALRAVLGWVLALGFAVNAWNVARDMSIVRTMTGERKSLYRVVQKAGLSNSVVFVRDWVGRSLPLEPTDLTRNSPDRNDPVLYVRDLGEKNKLLMQAMPQRNFYLGTYNKEEGIARLLPVEKMR